ncbi:MAG: hypothetical protein H3C48_10335 [Chitinophagaceae bacterium]|nr:hypothetical protein [Chitinophagaceae bacterium]
MKFIIAIVLTALVSFLAGLYTPWWTIAVAAFLVPFIIIQKPYMAFLAGFIAIFLLWGGLSFWISSQNNHLLAHKIAVVIIKSDAPWLLIGLTALTGGVVAAFSALSGALLRRLL